MEAARVGDRSAWEQIFACLRPQLLRFARSRGVSDPEDLVQEVMVAAVGRIDDIDGGWTALRAWMFTVASRRCADFHRRRYRRPEVLTDTPPEGACPSGTADEGFFQDAAAHEAAAALSILDERERDVVTLRVVHELSARAVADILGLSPVHVRVIQSRALVKLRRYLENGGGHLDKRFRSFLPVALLRAFRPWPLSDSDSLVTWAEAVRSSRPPSPGPPAPGVISASTSSTTASAAAVSTSAAVSGLTHTVAAVVLVAAGVAASVWVPAFSPPAGAGRSAVDPVPATPLSATPAAPPSATTADERSEGPTSSPSAVSGDVSILPGEYAAPDGRFAASAPNAYPEADLPAADADDILQDPSGAVGDLGSSVAGTMSSTIDSTVETVASTTETVTASVDEAVADTAQQLTGEVDAAADAVIGSEEGTLDVVTDTVDATGDGAADRVDETIDAVDVTVEETAAVERTVDEIGEGVGGLLGG